MYMVLFTFEQPYHVQATFNSNTKIKNKHIRKVLKLF